VIVGESTNTRMNDKRYFNIEQRTNLFPSSRRYMFNFMCALRAYKDGLLEKLEDQQKLAHNSS
jgi:hypothetical protein